MEEYLSLIGDLLGYLSPTHRCRFTFAPPPPPGIFRKAMSYQVDSNTGLLYIFRHGFHLPCIPEARILTVLCLVHDEAGHWGKQYTLAKLRGFAYWPAQSTDVENYICGCLQCARHGPATKSQLLQPVRVYRPYGFYWPFAHLAERISVHSTHH